MESIATRKSLSCFVMYKLSVKQPYVITRSMMGFFALMENIGVWDRSAFSTMLHSPLWCVNGNIISTVQGPIQTCEGLFLPVSVISTIRRCEFENSLCSCFFQCGKYEGYNPLETAFWSALMPSYMLPSFSAVGTKSLKTSMQSFLLKRSVLFCSCNGNCALFFFFFAISKNKVVGCDKGSSLRRRQIVGSTDLLLYESS